MGFGKLIVFFFYDFFHCRDIKGRLWLLIAARHQERQQATGYKEHARICSHRCVLP
jgi:hypothetical protein